MQCPNCGTSPCECPGHTTTFPGTDIDENPVQHAIGLGKGVGTLTCTGDRAGDGDENDPTACLAEIAEQCASWSNCTNFAMSPQWQTKAAQAFDGSGSVSGQPTCNKDWTTWCEVGKCKNC